MLRSGNWKCLEKRKSKTRKRPIIIVTALIILFFTAGFFVYTKFFADKPGQSIAVLPFTDMSPAKDQEYFSDGMSEELLNLLSKVQDLKVISRTSSRFFGYLGVLCLLRFL